MPTTGDCIDHADATCVTGHGSYVCYASQILSNGSCSGTSSATCSTMSAQDDIEYMRRVIRFVKACAHAAASPRTRATLAVPTARLGSSWQTGQRVPR